MKKFQPFKPLKNGGYRGHPDPQTKPIQFLLCLRVMENIVCVYVGYKQLVPWGDEPRYVCERKS